MQLAKQLIVKLKQKFNNTRYKYTKSKNDNSKQHLLANQEEFIYDDNDHLSLYSFTDQEQIVKMLYKTDIDNIISYYTTH